MYVTVDISFIILCNLTHIHIYTDNDIGDEGAKVLGEALKRNIVITTLNLGSIQ